MPVGYHPKTPEVIETYTGKFVDVAQLTPEQVDIRDIAHALSQLSRHGGHCLEKITVAQHAAMVHDIIQDQGGEPELCFAGLMHDAEEAYLGCDMPAPHKNRPEMVWYRALGDQIRRVIFDRYKVDYSYYAMVKPADNIALCAEIRQQKCSGGHYCELPEDPDEALIEPWGCLQAEQEFLRRFRIYFGLSGVLVKPRAVHYGKQYLGVAG